MRKWKIPGHRLYKNVPVSEAGSTKMAVMKTEF